MAELSWIPAKLPTRGVYYPDGAIPDGEVQIRKLTIDEENILVSQGVQGLERFSKVLNNCVKMPDGCSVSVNELLSTDRMALALAIRTITFGPHYNFNLKCEHCGEMFRAYVHILEDLDEDTPDVLQRKHTRKHGEDADPLVFEEPLAVELVDEGLSVTLRFLRGTDEKSIAKRAKRQRMQSNDPTDPSYLLRIATQIVEVDGKEMKIQHREPFVRKLTSADGARMRQAVDAHEPGIDLRIYPDCTACGGTNERTMPFTAEFFRPSEL